MGIHIHLKIVKTREMRYICHFGQSWKGGRAWDFKGKMSNSQVGKGANTPVLVTWKQGDGEKSSDQIWVWTFLPCLDSYVVTWIHQDDYGKIPSRSRFFHLNLLGGNENSSRVCWAIIEFSSQFSVCQAGSFQGCLFLMPLLLLRTPQNKNLHI